MDIIAQIKETEDFALTILPSIAAFVPLLERNKAQILEIPKKSFKYGETDRHQLDVYFPLKGSSDKKVPILFFIYGGGFTSGDRTFAAPRNLGYTNVGSFFAKRGFLTIIPDYRLVPNVTFPGPAQDICDAISWAAHNPQHLTIPESPDVDVNSIFLMGHSAGAAHVSTLLLLPEILDPTDLHSRIAGAILNGGPYRFNNIDHGPLAETLVQYYGSLEEGKKNDAYNLLERAPESTINHLPKILIVESEREPSIIREVGKDFKQSLEARIDISVKKVVAAGHNHFSINWALSSGEGEIWGEEVAEWMKSVIKQAAF